MQILAGLKSPFACWQVAGFMSDALAYSSVYDGIPAATNPSWTRYTNCVESRKRTMNRPEQFGSHWTYIEPAFQHLSSPEAVAAIEQLTGIHGLQPDPDRWGAGLHVTEGGGHLTPHVDFAVHPLHPHLERRVSLIHFLTPQWQHSWGGAFLACDGTGTVAAEFYPQFNTSVIFCNSDSSIHGTSEQVAGSPERVTLACYYLAPKRTGVVRQRAFFLPPR